MSDEIRVKERIFLRSFRVRHGRIALARDGIPNFEGGHVFADLHDLTDHVDGDRAGKIVLADEVCDVSDEAIVRFHYSQKYQYRYIICLNGDLRGAHTSSNGSLDEDFSSPDLLNRPVDQLNRMSCLDHRDCFQF